MTNTNTLAPTDTEIDAIAAPAQAGEYPELPPLQVRYDGLGHTTTMGYGVSQMRAYADATCAARGAALDALKHPALKPDMLVNGGALKLALNVLRRAGKNEVADELECTAQAAPAVPAIGQTLSGEPTYRDDFLQLAQKCGAVLTGKPDASEAITVVFSVDAWRAFDLATAQAAPVDAAKLPSPANVGTAPKCLDFNDQAMWVLGWNECLDAARAAQGGEA